MPSSRARKIWFLLALAFLAFAVYGSLIPLNFMQTSFAEAGHQFWLGLKNWSFGGSGVDWGVNVALFVPISFCLLCAVSPAGSLPISRGMAVVGVVTFCGLATLAIEFAQNWFPPRVPSAADVFAQFIGTSLGVTAWFVIGEAATLWLAGYLQDRRPNKQFDWLVQAYVIGFLLYSVMPLDLTMRPAELYEKYKENRIVLVPFSHNYGSIFRFVYQMIADVVAFIPVGVFAATVSTSGRQSSRPMLWSLASGFVIVMGVELVQLLVRERHTDVTDLITGTLGVGLGVGIVQRWRAVTPSTTTTPIIVWKWLVAGCLYAVGLVAFYWSPFDFTWEKEQIRSGLSEFFAPPLSNAVMGSRFVGITSILRKLVLFIPLGAIIAFATDSLGKYARRGMRFVLLILASALGLLIEFGQIALPSHSAAFGDALLYSAATLTGLLAANRLLNARACETPGS
jgi:glycopeptide antibiotics resistance protein